MDEPLSSKDNEVLDEAKSRFHRCHEYESTARARFNFDLKFANGDSENMYQWPEQLMLERTRSSKPCLTVNKTRQHCLQIVNDARQNKAEVRVRPTGNGATFQAAEVFEGIVRHIEYVSNAQTAYETATWNQVVGGIGWWRVVTDYVSDDSFDQEIRIQRVPDPMSIYLDPDIQQYDGSDACFGFVFTDMPRDEFDAKYPKWKDAVHSDSAIGEDHANGWASKDHVRLAEYYRKVEKDDVLHYLDDGTSVRRSQVKAIGPNLMDELDARTVKKRDVLTPEIEWYLLAGGDVVLEKSTFPGKYVPLVRVVGEETVIDGLLDRRGHVRALIDPQRIYNAWTSAAVEQVALQSKTPYITAIAAVEGYEEYWANANTVNYSYLPYNAYDDEGREQPKPERQQPPVMAQAYIDGLKISQAEMMMVSGQYQASMGEPSNERSGKAINERQRQGDNATYHYIDHLAQAIRFTGRILVDLIPHIYDTPRVLKIMGQDGTPSTIGLDPNAPQAHQPIGSTEFDVPDPQTVQLIFNPSIGDYAVEADVGPSFGTKRQEAFAALTTILSQNESLTPMIGDLLFRSADFPLADEIADRMKRMVPPQALGQIDPQVQQLQQQLQQAGQAMQQMHHELMQAKTRLLTTEQQKEIDEYRAMTERMKAVGGIDPDAMKPIIRQMISEALATEINPLIHAHALEGAITQSAVSQIVPPSQPNQPQQPPQQASTQ